MQKDLETVLYRQKLAHKAWQDKVFVKGINISKEASNLVWELFIVIGEGLNNFDRVAEDVFKISNELAEVALVDTPVDKVFKYYRDYVVESIMDYVDDNKPEQLKSMVRLSNVISSAFSDANASKLKKTMRIRRTEHLSQELKVAKQIQGHLMPKMIPSIPGFDFAGLLIPAAEIGGDYWSVKHYPKDDIVTLKLADITGHGIAAATLVAAVKFISGAYYKSSKSPIEVMQHTNRILTKETPHEILTSMVYGWLNPKTYELSVVNAGHAPAFICSEELCTDISLTGPLMGFVETAEYTELKYNLKKGDLVFFGSDGITEAGIGEHYGVERLKKQVLESKHLSAKEIADAVVQSVMQYSDLLHDDISIVIIKVTGDPPETRKGSAQTADT